MITLAKTVSFAIIIDQLEQSINSIDQSEADIVPFAIIERDLVIRTGHAFIHAKSNIEVPELWSFHKSQHAEFSVYLLIRHEGDMNCSPGSRSLTSEPPDSLHSD